MHAVNKMELMEDDFFYLTGHKSTGLNVYCVIAWSYIHSPLAHSQRLGNVLMERFFLGRCYFLQRVFMERYISNILLVYDVLVLNVFYFLIRYLVNLIHAVSN